MKIEFEINENEFDYDWEDNCYLRLIHTNAAKSSIAIEANKEGLISLAKILFSIAYVKELPPEVHFWGEIGAGKAAENYVYGDLDEGSLDLSIEKIEKQGRNN